ncbi:caspase family protein [Glycomyces sp. NPDC049804]|uniref:caspase family protein n=1 Tax=Glycomyces sp. NPDC049804 TaxID=3154363 RepID=UPI003413B488
MSDRRYRALLIGNAVFRRDPQGLPRLHGPRADVDALCEALADPQSGLFAPEDIEPLIDRNVQSLREELYRFFIEEATRDDVLLLYYSGHGKLDLQGRLHLCAGDTRVGSLPVTALKYKEDIEALVKESPASSAVTVLDCCHSGAFRGGELKVKASGKGRCVITSASANELALDTPGPGGTSPFTSALVTGLRFAQAEGPLTAQDLYDYLEAELSPVGNSRPQFYFDGEGAIALARRHSPAPPEAAPQPSVPDLPREEGEQAAAQQDSGGPLQSADEDVAQARSPGLALPEPRTHLWRLLNEAAVSAHSLDRTAGSSGALATVVREAVGLDARWPKAILKRVAEGRTKQALVEALASGLALHDAAEAFEFAGAFVPGTPERTGAHLAIAAALSESDHALARQALDDAIASSMEGEGERGTHMILRLLEIGLTDDHETRSPPAVANAALVRVARSIGERHHDLWGDLLGDLARRIVAVEDPELKAALKADAGLRLSPVNREAATGYFLGQGHFLPESAFADIPITRIIRGAAAMLQSDPPSGHRLLEIAERRCQTEEDWTAFFYTLLEQMQTASSPDPLATDHLVTVAERAVDRVPEEVLGYLRTTAVRMFAEAPSAAGRLLRLDPDEDRMRGTLVQIAKNAAAVDTGAAREIALAAERLVPSIIDGSEQAAALAELAEAFAAIDPGHAIDLLKSLSNEGYRKSMAISRVARVFATSFPDRIETLLDEFAPDEDDEHRRFDVYDGIARVDPARAIRLATPLPESMLKRSVIDQAAAAMARIDPQEAEALALGIQDPFHRAQTLETIIHWLVRDQPSYAADLARQIPESGRCAYARATALVVVSRALAAHDPVQAEELLALAERAAARIDSAVRRGPVLCDIADTYNKVGAAPIRVSKLLAQAEDLAAAGAERQIGLLVDVMVAWAAIAPRQAERVAASLPADGGGNDMKFRQAALAMAPNDPRRAEQFALKITDRAEQTRTVVALVEEFCESAPARAERLALAMEPGSHRTKALLTVAQALHRRRSGE